QLRLPAEGPLKRRDGSSCKSTLNPLPGLGFSTHGTTLFTVEPRAQNHNESSLRVRSSPTLNWRR
ncbi:MAG: hypothetical protein V3T60_02300, partial [Candidatus Binatia bacterium]